jgi:hypothetical protein
MSNLDPQQFLNATEQVAYNAVRDAISHLEDFDLQHQPNQRDRPCIPSATIGDIRWLNGRSLLALCKACSREEVLSFEGLADSVRLSWFANRFVCKCCGHYAAYILPTWRGTADVSAKRSDSVDAERASKMDTAIAASGISLGTQELQTEGRTSRERQVLKFITAKALVARLSAFLTHLQITVITARWPNLAKLAIQGPRQSWLLLQLPWRSSLINKAIGFCGGLRALDVRFGSLADMASALPNFRFTPESGHHRTPTSCLLSAMSRHRRGHRPDRDSFSYRPVRQHIRNSDQNFSPYTAPRRQL